MSIKILDILGATARSDEQVIQYFETTTALHAYPAVENSTWAKGDVIAVTLGNTAKFDGVYAIWAWDPTSTAVASSSVVLPTAFTTPLPGRWIMLFCECGGGIIR